MREIVTEGYLKRWKPREGENNPPAKDEYWTKVLKLIPAEVVTLYIFLTGIIGEPTAENSTILWVVFLVGLVGVPFFLIVVTKVGNYLQVCISAIAFVVWAMALGGPFTLQPWYQPMYGQLALPVFTFFVAPFVK